MAAVTVGESLCDVAASAFGSWVDELATKLGHTDMPAEQARDLAVLLVSVLQGAHVLCRAAGDVEPFDRAARGLLDLVPGQDP